MFKFDERNRRLLIVDFDIVLLNSVAAALRCTEYMQHGIVNLSLCGGPYLYCFEDDTLGEMLQVVWEIESYVHIVEKVGLPELTRLSRSRSNPKGRRVELSILWKTTSDKVFALSFSIFS